MQIAPNLGIWERFTPRERDVFDALRRGLSDAEMATALGVSVHTVKVHLRRTFRKAAVASRTALVSVVYRLPAIEAVATMEPACAVVKQSADA